MAFSWLRQHSILRSRFFIEARLFSRSTSRTYTYRIRNRLLPESFNHESTVISCFYRPLSTSSAIGTISISHNREMQTSVLQFSSKSKESHSYAYVQMPDVSQLMLGGTITKWMKKEGDKVSFGEELCRIHADGCIINFESLKDGYLAKILMPEGSTNVRIGEFIAVMVENADNLNSVMEKFVSKSDVNKEKSVNTNHGVEEKIPETSSAYPGDSSLPPHVVLEMPALSPTMDQGNITKWRKKEGDKLEVGGVICEIETDKATLEFESLEEGYIAKILVPEGSKDVLVGSPIVITVEDPKDIEALKSSKIGTKEGNIPVSSHAKHEGYGDKTIFKRISPSAKLLIAEHGLDISSLKASGPHGTLLKGDILAAINAGTKAPKEGVQPPYESDTQRPTEQSPISRLQPGKSDSYVDIPNSQIRKIIARRLLESKQNTPHFYMSSDVILDPLLSFRKEINEKYGVKVSVNDMVIKIVSIALKNVPESNAYWNVEKEDITLCDSVDISIAVATEKGLMTPIIRNADHKTISAISSEVKLLAEKARSGKLAPNEFQGGSFSISNLGMFPVDRFCAIINPPQACILAVGRGNKVVSVVVGDDEVDKPAVVTKMSLTLSADHRVFDSRVGGLFLSELGENFNNIARLLL